MSQTVTKSKSGIVPTVAGAPMVNYTFLVIYLVGMGAFGSFVNDMYQPTLPAMMHYFRCSVPVVQLGLTAGMVGLGLGQLIMGPLSDKYGRKPLLFISLIIFCIGSVASVFSPTIHFFLICRVVQGFGASGGYFLARTIPTDLYSGRALAKIMAVIGAINGIAPASAPVLGGVIADWLTWKGVFWFLALYGALLLCFAPKLKETLPTERRQQGSVGSAFRNYVTLLKNRPFMTHVILKGTSLGFLFAYISSGPFIFETHFGLSQTDFGLIMGLNAIFVAAGSMLALKFHPLKNAVFYAAIALILTGGLTIFILLTYMKTMWVYEVSLMPLFLCLGMIFSVSNTLAMNEGRAMAGDASAVLGIVGYIIGAAVSPLVGLGNIMHSTAIIFGVLIVITFVYAVFSYRLAPDIDS